MCQWFERYCVFAAPAGFSQVENYLYVKIEEVLTAPATFDAKATWPDEVKRFYQTQGQATTLQADGMNVVLQNYNWYLDISLS